MVLFHHERLDGSGFPMRRRDFAMECRIIQACDAFDSYITGMECIRIPLQDAIGKIQEGIIHKYDRKVVETLLSKIAYYPVGTVVKMSNQAEELSFCRQRIRSVRLFWIFIPGSQKKI